MKESPTKVLVVGCRFDISQFMAIDHGNSWEPVKLQGFEPPIIFLDNPICEHLETFEAGLMKLDKRKRRGMRRKYSRFIKLLMGETCVIKSWI